MDIGVNHEPGNVFIYAPRQEVLMLADVIFPGWVPFKDPAHDIALSYDFETFIGGHLARLGTRQDVEIQREYFQDMIANAGTALQTVDYFCL